MHVKLNDGNFFCKIFQIESLDNVPDEAWNNLILLFYTKITSIHILKFGELFIFTLNYSKLRKTFFRVEIIMFL